MCHRRINNIGAYALLALALVVGPCGVSLADDELDVSDSALCDSMQSESEPGNSTASDSVVLEPVLYRPGPDTTLIAAYYGRSEDTARGVSPSLTMLKSVAVPGWGQFSNRKYIKSGVIAVVESYFIYKAVDYAGLASDWREKWQAEPDTSVLRSTYFNQYAEYRDTRNSFIWYTVLTVFLSMIDAYVDAHLRNFPEDIPTPNNLSLDVHSGRETRLALSYRF